MDLVRGICFFCSNPKVVSDTQNVHNTLITLFTGTGINEERLLKLRPPRVCHLCYHSFVLMKRTHDDILHSSSAEKVHENCHLCGNSEDVIKVTRWSHFDKIGKDYRGLIGNAISNACSDCLYYLDTKNSVRDKLIAAHPQLNKVLDFVSNITSHSTPLRRTRTKAERKVPLEFIDLTDMDNDDFKKFKPLRRDRELKKSKLIAKDPKLMNQILIVKLQNLNKSLVKENDVVKIKKTGPQKKVRFKDIHELEEDISSTPKKIKYKETRYHDNFISSSNNDENYEAIEDELVEYEIKTSTPKKCKYREYSDDSNSDSSDGRKKSFFKIKLTKKKTFSEKPLKSALTKSPKSTGIMKSNHKLSSNVRPFPKSTKKQKPVARTRRNSVLTSNDEVPKPDLKYNLVINLERMTITESNNEDNIEVKIESEDLVESEDTLDPLLIDSLDNGDSQIDVDVEERNNVEDKNDKEVSQDDISDIPNTNGHTEESSEENQESSQDTESEVSFDKREIISISSDDGIKESKETGKIDDVGETLNEIKLFLQQSEIEKKNENLKETHEVKDKELDTTEDSQESKEEETIMTNDNVPENLKNKTDEEVVKDTDTSQFDENTESEVKDTSTEQNGNTLEEDLGEAKEESRNESQKEVEKVINNEEDETENIQEETENSQEEEKENTQEVETENRQEEETENRQEETENSQGETENRQEEETENRQEEETENSQGETENRQEEETENSREGETENSQEETENSKEEETENSQESQEENDVLVTYPSIDDVTAVSKLGSFETVSELDKMEDSEETEENLEIKKRKRDYDSSFDTFEPDKKKKRVTFSGDLSSD